MYSKSILQLHLVQLDPEISKFRGGFLERNSRLIKPVFLLKTSFFYPALSSVSSRLFCTYTMPQKGKTKIQRLRVDPGFIRLLTLRWRAASLMQVERITLQCHVQVDPLSVLFKWPQIVSCAGWHFWFYAQVDSVVVLCKLSQLVSY